MGKTGEELWYRLVVPIPVAWKGELQAAAQARGLPMSGLVRQLIRNLMLARHEQESQA